MLKRNPGRIVLLVTMNRRLVEVLDRYLRDEGFDVVRASKGPAAIASLPSTVRTHARDAIGMTSRSTLWPLCDSSCTAAIPIVLLRGGIGEA